MSEKNRDFRYIVAGVPVGASSGLYGVANCFRSPNIAFRDADLDRLLPKVMDAVDEGHACIVRVERQGLTFGEVLTKHLRIDGDARVMSAALVRRAMTFALPQIERIIESCKRGRNPLKLRVDGHANFFFVARGERIIGVCVDWHTDERKWGICVSRLRKRAKLLKGEQLIFRNP